MQAMIQVDNLVRHFGHIKAVNEISFKVQKGEVLGFLGPNGAGKSTTMKMITGFLAPTAGRIQVCGYDVDRQPIQAKAHMGYLPEGAPAYGDMTAGRFLAFAAQIRGLRGAAARQQMDDAIAKTDLAAVLQQPIETLSKGFKRRVGLAQAILHDPDVLILDEPTDGLDPNQKHEVRGLIRAMAKEKAIIISTHILEEVDAVCSRAVIIAQGRIVADGAPEDLQARAEDHNAVTLRTAADNVSAELEALSDVARVERLDDGRYRVFAAQGRAILPAIAAHARKQNWPLEELQVEAGRLDDVFRRITMEGAP